MRTAKILIALCLSALPVMSVAQSSGGLDPALLLKPLSDTWLTYSGDYSGRRYSALTQLNRTTVKNLTLAWVARLNGTAGAIAGGTTADMIFGGVGAGEYTNVNIKGSIVHFDDTL